MSAGPNLQIERRRSDDRDVALEGPNLQIEHRLSGDREVAIEGRAPFPYPRCATRALGALLLLKLALIAGLLASRLWLGEVPREYLIGLFAEVAASNFFVFFCCRWEAQHHWVTLWAVLTGTSMFVVIVEVIEDPILLVAAVLLSKVSMWNAAYCDVTEVTPARLPPFLPMNDDPIRKPYGWLGEWASRQVPRWRERRIITFLLRLTVLPTPWFECFLMLPVMVSLGVVDWLPQPGESNLHAPFLVAVLLDLFQAHRFVLWSRFLFVDWAWHRKPRTLESARAFRQDENEVVSFDSDPWGSAMPQCHPLTVSMVSYMPNEEDTVVDVLNTLKTECDRYPGEVSFLFCWNSPMEHEETVELLDALAVEWPQFRHYHVRTSKSKAENLNFMLDRVTTEYVIFLDSDTLFSTQTLIYASTLTDDPRKLDWVQGRVALPREDMRWWTEDGFACRPFTAAWDAETFDWVWPFELFGYTPFYGHAAMWRTEAARRLGFDHRTVGEDFDIALRAHAYFGYRSICDPHLLFSERAPPSIPVCVKQRVRWSTTAYQFRPNISWFMRSPHVSELDAVLFAATMLGGNPLPLQSLPDYFVRAVKTLLLGQLFYLLFAEEGPVDLTNPNNVLGLAFMILIVLEAVVAPLSVIVRRYRVSLMKPRWSIFIWYWPFLLLKQFFYDWVANPGALHNFLWGYNVFTVTARASSKDSVSHRSTTSSKGSSVASTRVASKDSLRSLAEGEIAEESPAGSSEPGGALAIPPVQLEEEEEEAEVASGSTSVTQVSPPTSRADLLQAGTSGTRVVQPASEAIISGAQVVPPASQAPHPAADLAQTGMSGLGMVPPALQGLSPTPDPAQTSTAGAGTAAPALQAEVASGSTSGTQMPPTPTSQVAHSTSGVESAPPPLQAGEAVPGRGPAKAGFFAPPLHLNLEGGAGPAGEMSI